MKRKTKDGMPTGRIKQMGDESLACAMVNALKAIELPERWTHRFHTYPAGLHPDAARDLLAIFKPKRMYDPFCGGGTVLVEGMARGAEVVGSDLSPTALRVARARTWRADDALLTQLRSRARKMTAVAQEATDYPESLQINAIAPWYADCAMMELESLRRGLLESDDAIRPILESIFSSILIKVSWRRSDTNASQQFHRRPPGTTATFFHKRTREYARGVVQLTLDTPDGTPPATVMMSDARTPSVEGLFDLIITSPPYPAVYDYLSLQHLRTLWFDEFDRADKDDEIGSRGLWRAGEKHAIKRWTSDTRQWMKASAKHLTADGHFVVVIGDGLVQSGPIDTLKPTIAAAKKAGLRLLAGASMERPDYARDSSRMEHVLAFVHSSPQ